MIRFVLPALTVLGACAAPTAPPNPNSVPAVLESLTQARSVSGALYVTGGIYDGAAVGQTTRFVVTPTDQLICTFQTDPVAGEAGGSTLTAHRFDRPGLYAALAGGLLPNVVPSEVEYTTNFTIEHRGPTGLTTTQTGFGDPRFDAMTGVFEMFPTTCWSFG